jgi:hypothetical protein
MSVTSETRHRASCHESHGDERKAWLSLIARHLRRRGTSMYPNRNHLPFRRPGHATQDEQPIMKRDVGLKRDIGHVSCKRSIGLPVTTIARKAKGVTFAFSRHGRAKPRLAAELIPEIWFEVTDRASCPFHPSRSCERYERY